MLHGRSHRFIRLFKYLVAALPYPRMVLYVTTSHRYGNYVPKLLCVPMACDEYADSR